MVLFQMVAVKNLFGCILKWFCQIKVRFLERLVFNRKNIFKKLKVTILWRYARVEIFQNRRNASIFSARGRISVMRTIYIKWTQTGVAYLGQWHFRKKWEFFAKKGG